MFTPHTSVTAEGLLPFVVDGETYQTWYKVFGDISNSTHPPLVVLHGGPGLSHDYLLPLSDLATDRAVILYDQIGNSRSTHVRDKPMEFWNIDLFINELENLIAHFHIQDNFDILGHSWGGILGSEFVVRRHPAGLKHLILSNSLASMALWNQANMELMAAFPQDVQDALKGGFGDMPKYRAALNQFYAVHGCVTQTIPQEFVYSLDRLFGPESNPTVAMAMFGGELKEWSIIDRVSEIRVPVLVLNGKADISLDYVIKPFVDGIPKVQWVKLEHSSHSPMWEEREKYMEVIGGFLST